MGRGHRREKISRGDGNWLKFLGYLAERGRALGIKESTAQKLGRENELVCMASGSVAPDDSSINLDAAVRDSSAVAADVNLGSRV